MLIDKVLTGKIADLANLSLGEKELEKLTDDFVDSMQVVDELLAIETTDVAPTYQVNDLENVWREDVVNETTQFTQAEALANAPRVHQGYFVVERLIDRDN